MLIEELHDYSPDSLARKIGITRRTLDRLMKAGRGPGHLRIGRRIVIRRQAAEDWLTSLEVPLTQSVKHNHELTAPAKRDLVEVKNGLFNALQETGVSPEEPDFYSSPDQNASLRERIGSR